MQKRHKIMDGKIRKYKVHEGIEEVLDALSFSQEVLDIPSWKLYKKEDKNQFAAIYGDNEFFVEGNFSSIDTTKKDLETISKLAFEENKFLKIVRKDPIAMMGIVPLTALGTLIYFNQKNIDYVEKAIEYFELSDSSSPETAAVNLVVLGILGGTVLGGTIGAISREGINRLYGSKLSKDAESYNYGLDGEQKLNEEIMFDGIKSGKIDKQDYLNLRGYAC